MTKQLIILIFIAISISSYAQRQPKLVVGVVVDQMSYEYLYRYQSRFSKGGFKKLMTKGANCENVHYNYVPTYTAPGHASIYTGTTPSNHGIVGNEWLRKDSGLMWNCVSDSTVHTIGSDSKEGERSPQYLKSLTITDQLKITYPESRVYAVSIKDRSAILPGGTQSDGSFWYDSKTGRFISSSYYFENELPSFVQSFNNLKKADAYLTQTWNALYPIDSYQQSLSDDSPYELTLKGKDKPIFPYHLAEMKGKSEGYELLIQTPFGNSIVNDFALHLLKNTDLGKGPTTDFLALSFSSTDIIGHNFGTYSIELEDTYLRLDLEIEKLLHYLDKTYRKNNYLFFLTADHAATQVPQFLIDNKLPGGYLFIKEPYERLNAQLKEKYGKELMLSYYNLNIYLDDAYLKEHKIDKEEVVSFIASEIKQWKGVKLVMTANEIRLSGTDSEWKDMIRRGFHEKESGDLVFMLEPGYLSKSKDSEKARKGTSHGAAYNTDTHVPLLWYGKNIPAKSIFRSIAITDIAATLVYFLEIQRPGAMTGQPIIELLEKITKK